MGVGLYSKHVELEPSLDRARYKLIHRSNVLTVRQCSRKRV